MKKNITTQYNNFHNIYTENFHQDEISNSMFYQGVDFELQNKKLLDVGCGDAVDLKHFSEQGAQIFGLEPSIEFLKKAKENNPTGTFIEGVGENMPFEDNSFDIIISKWALQTSPNVQQVMLEAARVLKPGGILYYLSKHPMLQFLQKIRDFGHGADYYERKVVTSNIYSGKIVLKEPSHTMGDYFNKEFFSNFELLNYEEETDFPASEQLNGDTYPTFFVVKARRK